MRENISNVPEEDSWSQEEEEEALFASSSSSPRRNFPIRWIQFGFMMLFIIVILSVARKNKAEQDFEYTEGLEIMWDSLDEDCLTLENCPSPRKHPKWNNVCFKIQYNWILGRLLKLIALFMENREEDWHIVSGTLLTFLRRRDFSPHEHDVDILVKNRDFILKNIDQFPEDVNVLNGWKLVDMNTCFIQRNSPMFLDIFDERNIVDFMPNWTWYRDSLPVHYRNVHNMRLGYPSNWKKNIRIEFGEDALVYRPRPFDEGVQGSKPHERCEANEFNNFLRPTEVGEDGRLKRSQKPEN